jgi:putative spermidine/putrescine transport system permease protein
MTRERQAALRREAAGPLGRLSPPVAVAVALILVFLAAPTVIVIPISFSSATYLTFPPPGWSTQWYARYFGSDAWMGATYRSFAVASLTMVTSTILGTAAAFGLRRLYVGRDIAHLLVVAPLVVPGIIIAIAVYDLYSRLLLIGSIAGLVIAHTIIAFPFVAVVVAAALRGLDKSLERAAANLGANAWTTFRLVTFPLIRPGIAAGALLAFIASFDEVVIAIFISGTTSATLPKLMWDGIRTEVDPTIAAVSTLLVALSTLLLGAVSVLRRSRPS